MWDELGIAPTSNVSTIRAAYAARLKVTRPDRDPAGFTRLRVAYEQAVALARSGDPAEPPPPIAPLASALPPESAPPPTDTAADHEPTPKPAGAGPDTLDAIAPKLVAALRGGNAASGFDLYETALRGGTLPIHMEMVLTDIILEFLVASRDVTPALLTDAAKRFGWDDGAAAAASNPRLKVLQERLSAEAWYVAMQKRARSPLRLLGAHRSGAAALLFGKGGVFFSRHYPPVPELLTALSELHAQARWVGHRFDPRRIAALDQVIADIRGRALRRYTDRPRWRHAFDRANLPITLIAAPAAFAVYLLTSMPTAATSFFLASRVLLAYRLRLRRPYALVAVLCLAACLALIALNNGKPGFAISFATPAPSVNLASFLASPRAALPMTIPPEQMMAARRGDLDAMRGIGQSIIGSARNEASMQRGAAWLTTAANRGSIDAMLDLANLYGDLNRDYILYDSDRAYFWSGVAALRGGALSRTASQAHARLRGNVVPADIADLDRKISAWMPSKAPLPE